MQLENDEASTHETEGERSQHHWISILQCASSQYSSYSCSIQTNNLHFRKTLAMITLTQDGEHKQLK